jgi:hypothetical protein
MFYAAPRTQPAVATRQSRPSRRGRGEVVEESVGCVGAEPVVLRGAVAPMSDVCAGVWCDHGSVNMRPTRTPVERRLGYLRVLEARSRSTPAQRLRALATDDIRPVRVWTARNPDTPADALHVLAQDDDATVRWNALLHPRTPPEALQILADGEAATASANWFIVRGPSCITPTPPHRCAPNSLQLEPAAPVPRTHALASGRTRPGRRPDTYPLLPPVAPVQAERMAILVSRSAAGRSLRSVAMIGPNTQ